MLLANGQNWVGPRQAFRPAPPRSTCMGAPWRPGRNATLTKVPSTLPVIGWYFNDISSFALVCAAAPSQLCLRSTSLTHPERRGLMRELLPRQCRKDHLVDDPASRRWLLTRLPLWVAKTRWIKCQPESRKIYSFPAEGYRTRNADGTEKRNRCGTRAGARARSVMHSIGAILTTAPYASPIPSPRPSMHSLKRRSESYRKYGRTK